MGFGREFQGVNEAYVLDLYEQYQRDPQAVDEAARAFFKDWSPPSPNGKQVTRPDITDASHTFDASDASFEKIMGAVNFAQSIRNFGHLAAQLDPLGKPPIGDPALTLETHRVTEHDLENLPAHLISGIVGKESANALEAIQRLREIYTSHIGFDFDHIRIPAEREWLREAVESRRYYPSTDPDYAKALLDRLTQVEVFEQFLQQAFPSKYRFSIEGLDTMILMLEELIVSSCETGISHILMGMAHRGRLNVLAHILHKPYEQILAEFKDPLRIQELRDALGWTTGDVKYHEGMRRVYKGERESNEVIITMPPNPSHLELVNPVVIGMARAVGTVSDRVGAPEFDPEQTLQILIHGDAAFPAQGINAETLNMLSLPGYWVGGSVHIIANNQIGFTTLPADGRSTLYASDLAKGFKIPIVHVNADDPIACIQIARIACAYQKTFEKDFMIDLIGYRRYGHNELDEPSYTQPLMYETVRAHPPVRKLWANTLIERGIIQEADAQSLIDDYRKSLQETYDGLEDQVEENAEDLFEPIPDPPPSGEAARVKTGISKQRLNALNESLKHIPDGFHFYSKRLKSMLESRRKAVENTSERAIDWGTAEELAFASILEEGIAIRLTGQDSERGTFSQRHAVLHDAETGETFVPLQNLPQAKASFEIHDSPLSEAAALGFEYGYSIQKPEQLIIWEAQYGDFINTAQAVIDEYLTSSREKWGLTCSVVLLLPHAWEGAGPDHSSGRLERWLQLSANTNIRIANCTSAAQYFHLLRRQALLLTTDPLPLVVLTPKSLLRNPAVASSPDDLIKGKWQPVINHPPSDTKAVQRLVLCSGKLSIDLLSADIRAQHPEVAIASVEQLYPFPIEPLSKVIDSYPNLKEIVWAQEEPKNMGAWDFMSWRLERLLDGRLPVNYVGRRRSPSPAEGSLTAHKTNQANIIEFAFTFDFSRKSEE